MVRLARELEKTLKYVISSRPVETTWKNSAHLQGPELDQVREIIESTSSRIVVLGSPSLSSSLLEAKLINEIHMLVQPFIGAASPRIYQGLGSRRSLDLAEARPFKSGVVLLRYEVSN